MQVRVQDSVLVSYVERQDSLIRIKFGLLWPDVMDLVGLAFHGFGRLSWIRPWQINVI
jgi:hypothetical protein